MVPPTILDSRTRHRPALPTERHRNLQNLAFNGTQRGQPQRAAQLDEDAAVGVACEGVVSHLIDTNQCMATSSRTEADQELSPTSVLLALPLLLGSPTVDGDLRSSLSASSTTRDGGAPTSNQLARDAPAGCSATGGGKGTNKPLRRRQPRPPATVDGATKRSARGPIRGSDTRAWSSGRQTYRSNDRAAERSTS